MKIKGKFNISSCGWAKIVAYSVPHSNRVIFVIANTVPSMYDFSKGYIKKELERTYVKWEQADDESDYEEYMLENVDEELQDCIVSVICGINEEVE